MRRFPFFSLVHPLVKKHMEVVGPFEFTTDTFKQKIYGLMFYETTRYIYVYKMLYSYLLEDRHPHHVGLKQSQASGLPVFCRYQKITSVNILSAVIPPRVWSPFLQLLS